MGTLSRDAFARRLEALSEDDLAAFLADCWAARGWDTTVEDGTVVATDHPARPDRRLGVGADAEAPTVVVPAADADGRTALDAGDLYGLCVYVLDRETADALCREHLGVTVSEGTGPSIDERVAGALPSRRTVEAAALLAVVAGGLLLLVPLGPSLPGLGESASAAPATPAPTADDAGGALTPMDTPASTAASSDPPVPGLSAAGVTDLERLADAHAAAVTGRSYRLTLGHREWIGDETAGGAREVVAVEGPDTYVSTVERWGRLETTPAVVAGADAYANGTYRYERVPTTNGSRAERTLVSGRSGGEGYHADRVERYLRWFLDAEETSVRRVPSEGRPASVDDATVGPLYRVTGSGTDFRGAEDYEVTALVTEAGFVREVRVSYAVPDADTRVAVAVRYADVGETVALAPGWVPGGGTEYGGPDGSTNGTTTETGWDDGEPDGGTVSTGDHALIDGLSMALRAGVDMNVTTPRPVWRTGTPEADRAGAEVVRP